MEGCRIGQISIHAAACNVDLKHRAVGLLELVFMLSSVTAQDELLSNGGFAAPLSPVTLRASRGHFSQVSAVSGDMFPFPDVAMTAALQISAQDLTDGIRTTTHVQLRSAFGSHGAGWYCVRFFAIASQTFNGLDAPIALEVVDGEGHALWPAHMVRLRPYRGEWLYYESWVHCNPLPILDGYTNAMRSALQIRIAPGGTFTSGTLQLTGASVTFVPVGQRDGLTKLDLCRCTDPDGRTAQGYCSSPGSPSCQPPLSCPIPTDSRGDCQATDVSLSGTSPESAYDGIASELSRGWYIAAEWADTIVLDVEIPEAADLGAPVPVCAARLTFDGRYPQRWRIKASQTPESPTTTLVEAGAATGDEGAAWRAAIASDRVWTSSGDGQLDVALGCEAAGRVRLEMEDANADGLYIRLLELELLTATPSLLDCHSKCRNGGKCDGHGECACPFDSGCTSAACGYTGDMCDTPECVATIVCNMQGICDGPNTCTCAPGWHGLTGLEQCLSTECGDGELTPSEGCDDGNTVPGDGCDSNCALEPLPAGHTRVLSDKWSTEWLPREDIHAPSVTEETIGITLAVRPEQVRAISLGSVVNGVDGVQFEYAEYEVRCDRECYNGGTCVTRGFENDFAPGCICQDGFDNDERCGSDSCLLQCDHGGYCTSNGVCANCASGWQGDTCGTISSPIGDVVVAMAALTMVLLIAAVLLVVYRRSFPPLRARGITSVIAKCCGGIVWLATAVVSLRGEQFDYDSAINTLRGPMIIGGFGLWYSSNLLYLRSMAQIHLFHRVPVAFLLMLCICIGPWVISALVQSYTAALAVGVVYFAYTLQLLATLWPIRNDLTDVVHHGVGCLFGIVNVIFSVWLMERADKTRNDPWASEADVAAAFSSVLALGNAAATVVVVLLHFISSVGPLLYKALLKFDDPAVPPQVRALYHNDFQPTSTESNGASKTVEARRAQLENFDSKIRAHAKTISSAKGRVARTRFFPKGGDNKGGNAIKPLETQETTTGGEAAFTGMTYGARMHIWLGEVAKRSTVGRHLHRHAFHREQFGQRRKLKPQTLHRLGRLPVVAVSQSSKTTTPIESQQEEDPESYFGRALQNETDEDLKSAIPALELPGATGVSQHPLQAPMPATAGTDATTRTGIHSSERYMVNGDGNDDTCTSPTTQGRDRGHQHASQRHHASQHVTHHHRAEGKHQQLDPIVHPHHTQHGHHDSPAKHPHHHKHHGP